MAAGGDQSFVMTNDGKILAFGANSKGQLGLGSQGKAGYEQNTQIPRLVGSKEAYDVKANFAGVGSTVLDPAQGTGAITGIYNQVSFYHGDKATVSLSQYHYNGFSLWKRPDEITNVNMKDHTIISSDESIAKGTIKDGVATIMAGDLTYAQFQKTGTATLAVVDPSGNVVSEFLVHVRSNDPDREGAKLVRPMIAAGKNGAIALKANGTVYTWGTLSKDNTQSMPKQVLNAIVPDATKKGTGYVMTQTEGLLVDIVYVAMGGDHYVAVRNDGTVWVWGDNSDGQLGRYNFDTVLEKTAVYGKDDRENDKREYIYTGIYNRNETSSAVPLNLTSYLAAKKTIADNINAGHTSNDQIDSNGLYYREIYPNEEVTVLPKIVAAAAGDRHTLLLGADGSVWAMGDNTYGQLGVGDNKVHYGVVQVLKGAAAAPDKTDGTAWKDGKYLSDIIQISADGNSSTALRSDGTVWTWGRNDSGELGMESVGGTYVPVQVEKSQPDVDKNTKNFYLENIFQIAAGHEFVLAAGLRDLTGTGAAPEKMVYSWGRNDKGQLGIGEATGDPFQIPQLVLGLEGAGVLTNVRQVAAGGDHSLAMVKDDTATQNVTDSAIVGWGSNAKGQLGINAVSENPQTTPVKMLRGGTTSGIEENLIYARENLMLAGGDGFSVLIREEGSVWATGLNDRAQGGNGSVSDTRTLTQVGNGNYYFMEIGSAAIYPSGGKQPGVTASVTYNPMIRSVTLQANEWLYIDHKELIEVYSSAFNVISDEVRRKIDPKAEFNFTSSDPTIAYFQRFEDDWYLIPTGRRHGSIIITVEHVGSNYRGYYEVVILADDELVDPTYNILVEPKLAAGLENNIALRADGTVWIWGTHTQRVNRNDGTPFADPVVYSEQYPVQISFSGAGMAADEYIIDVAAGGTRKSSVGSGVGNNNEFFLALSNKGKVYAWGSNEHGQLGDGNWNYYHVGYYFNSRWISGHPNYDRMSPKVVKVNDSTALTNVIGIAAGGAHALAVTSDGKVYSWGLNDFGQLGINDGRSWSWVDGYHRDVTVNGYLRTYAQQVVGVYNDGTLKDIIAVAAGANHSVALRKDGAVFTWGDNSYGQLGNTASGLTGRTILPVQVAAGEYNPDANYIEQITRIAAGDGHTLAMTRFGQIFAWGDNRYGQLGSVATLNGKTNMPSLVNTTTANADSREVDIAAGRNHSMARTSDDLMLTWGLNTAGELGRGNNLSPQVTPGSVLRGDGVDEYDVYYT